MRSMFKPKINANVINRERGIQSEMSSMNLEQKLAKFQQEAHAMQKHGRSKEIVVQLSVEE